MIVTHSDDHFASLNPELFACGSVRIQNNSGGGCHHISDIQVAGHHHRQQTEQEAQIHFLKKLRSLNVCSKRLEIFYGWCTCLCCGLLGGAASEPATLTDTTN